LYHLFTNIRRQGVDDAGDLLLLIAEELLGSLLRLLGEFDLS